MPSQKKRILITGGYGLVGNLLFRHLAQQADQYSLLCLDRSDNHSSRIREQDVYPIPSDQLVQADLSNFNALLEAVHNMDAVVHLAADPDGHNWDSVRDNNIVGTYNLFEACRQAGVPRIVFASSIMVHFGYHPDELYGNLLNARPLEDIPLLTHENPTRPSGIYAASKIWGEALAFVYSYQHALSCLCVRLGWVVAEDRPRPDHCGGDWLSFRDCARFLQLCVDAPQQVRYEVLYAVSDNRYRFVDLERARQVLGYVPLDGDLHLFDQQGFLS